MGDGPCLCGDTECWYCGDGPSPEPRKVGWTCPAIDKVARIVRAHVREEKACREALRLLEELREDNAALRARAQR